MLFYYHNEITFNCQYYRRKVWKKYKASIGTFSSTSKFCYSLCCLIYLCIILFQIFCSNTPR